MKAAAVSDFEQEQIVQLSGKGKSIMEIARHLALKKTVIAEVLRDNPKKKDTGGVCVSKRKLKIDNAGDVKKLIVRIIEKLEKEPIEPKITNSIFYGANLLMEYYKDFELESRIKKIEGMLCQRKKAE